MFNPFSSSPALVFKPAAGLRARRGTDPNVAQASPFGTGWDMPMKISVVIPIFNEEGNIETLYDRLIPVLAGIGGPYEIVFCNDGSGDGSAALLDA